MGHARSYIPKPVQRKFSVSGIFKESTTYIGPSLKLAWKSSPWLCTFIAITTLISAALPIVVALIAKQIIDAIVAHNSTAALQLVLIEGIVMVVQGGVHRFLFLLETLLGGRLGVDVNVMILQKATTLELRHFEDSDTYDSLTRARREASLRPVALVTDTLRLLQSGLTFLSYIGLLLVFSPWVVLGLIAAAIPATISEMRFSNVAFRLRNWRSPDTRKLNYLEYVLATDIHVKEVKVLGLSQLFLERYRSLGNRFYLEDKRLATQRSFWAFSLSLLSTATFYGCYAVLVIWAAIGKLTLGNLTLYITAFRQGQLAFQTGLTSIGSMYESNLYMSNLFAFLEIETKETGAELDKRESPLAPQPTPHSKTQAGAIRFENLGFCYPGKETWALRNLDFEIPAGQSLAIVGHNGAGKSTLIKLLCRLYDPTEGRILLDGLDLRKWNLDALRARIGVVFQDFSEYQLSVKDNVGIGAVDYMDDLARVARAIEKGGATEFLHDLPNGLDTPLGRWFNGGIELSGGQWQKIALARGFMREDSDILILDEPTSALDAMAEQAVFDRFRQLTAGKTSLLISHRFPTVRMADRIIVIEGGRLLEEGTHDTLVAKNGRYAELFALQAKGYL